MEGHPILFSNKVPIFSYFSLTSNCLAGSSYSDVPRQLSFRLHIPQRLEKWRNMYDRVQNAVQSMLVGCRRTQDVAQRELSATGPLEISIRKGLTLSDLHVWCLCLLHTLPSLNESFWFQVSSIRKSGTERDSVAWWLRASQSIRAWDLS